MKRLIILIVVIILSLTLFGQRTINNEDSPLKGKWDFNLKRIWEVESAGKDMLVQAGSIIIGDEGNVYIMERKHGKIFSFNSDGKFINSIGKKGEGPGEYKQAFRIHLHENIIIVPDMGRFHYFKKSGEYLKTINSGVSFIFPKVMISKYSFIYEKGYDEKETKRDLINIFDLKTKKITKLSETVSKKPSTASSGGMRLVVKTDSTSVAYQSGDLFYGKGDKYLIKKINKKGEKLLSFGIKDRRKIKVTEKMKRKKYEGIVLNGGKMPKSMVDQLIKNDPDQAPYFNGIDIQNGFVFVNLVDPANEKSEKFDIFSNEGKYLYNAEFILPEDLTLQRGPVFKDGFAYVFAEDEDGEGKLIKYKVNLPE